MGLGGAEAAGANDFAKGLGAGAQVGVSLAERRDALARQAASQQLANQRAQAQQDLQNKQMQLALNRDQREAAASETAKQIAAAHIASANAQTAKDNMDADKTDLANHQKIVDTGVAAFQPYLDAGLKPVHENVPESKIPPLFANNTDAKGHLWEPTSIHLSYRNGRPYYEFSYSAIDPKGEVPVTPELKKQYKEAGMDPKFLAGLQGVTTVPAEQMVSMNRALKKAQADKKDSMTVEEVKASINRLNADAAKSVAEARSANQDAELKKEGRAKDRLTNEALKHYGDVGGDASKLSADEKIEINDYFVPIIKSLNETYKAEVDALDKNMDMSKADRDELSNKAKQTLGKIERFSSITDSIGAALPKVKVSADQMKTISENPGMTLMVNPSNGKAKLVSPEDVKKYSTQGFVLAAPDASGIPAPNAATNATPATPTKPATVPKPAVVVQAPAPKPAVVVQVPPPAVQPVPAPPAVITVPKPLGVSGSW